MGLRAFNCLTKKCPLTVSCLGYLLMIIPNSGFQASTWLHAIIYYELWVLSTDDEDLQEVFLLPEAKGDK